MKELSATEIARNFSDILDAVEHDGETYTVIRRGKAVAVIGPTRIGSGRALKEALRDAEPDPALGADILALRALLIEDDPWRR
jgi:prevent-host-death family protein